MEGSTLRTTPAVCTLKAGGLNFAARQRHRLENPLVPECGFLIRLLNHAAALACIFLESIPILFGHKK